MKDTPCGKARVKRQTRLPIRRVEIRDFFLPMNSRTQIHRRCAGISESPNRSWTRKMFRPNLPTLRVRQK